MVFLALPRKSRNMCIDGFAHSFVSPKKKKKEQKIFMFEKIDSLFVVVDAINRTTASVISGVLIFFSVKSQSWVCFLR